MSWLIVNPGRPIPGTGQNLTIGASSVQASAFDTHTQLLRISATGNCHVSIGLNPTATSTSMLVKATDPPQLIRIGRDEKLAVIQDGAATGTLNVHEYTN